MTIAQSRVKSSPIDPTINFVNALLQRARKAIINHDAGVIASRIRAMRSMRFPVTGKTKTGLQAPRAHRSHACARRATADSGSGGDPDPEPPHRATLGGAL
jgi:hypothetical protein